MTAGRFRALVIAGAICAALLASQPAVAQALSLPASEQSRSVIVVVDRGITHTNQLPTTQLRLLRKAMVRGAALTESDLRVLAERRDSLAALKMVKLLRARGTRANASDMAFYASVAAGAGRKGMLDDMIGALYRLDPASEPSARISQYIRVLYGYAWGGNSLAQDAMIALNGAGRLFGPMSDATRARILAEAESGGGRMVLSLAMKDLARDDLDAGDLTRVIGYLHSAERHGTLAIRAMAASLRQSAEARRDALAVN